jgi:formate dehydrogenase major subunit
MTNHWIDIKNSDCIMIIGSNPADNHPISFKWVTAAMENGAKLIHVDPRFTNTSAKADIYAPLRPGTDIAFIGGLINYILEKKLYNKEYIVEYTDAPFLVDENFDFNDGLFSGYDPETRQYDKSTWRYRNSEFGGYLEDKSLQDRHCVFQLLKKHFSRYDVDTVCAITGMPKDIFLEVVRTYGATGAPDKAGTIMYAMGATQHTVGTQNVRSYAILQLLLGNIGMAGGGINALRGESNVQGSTDHGLLFHTLPGYLNLPERDDFNLKTYLEHWTPKSRNPEEINYWKYTSRFTVSLLKAFWGDMAQKENDFCYDYLPKCSGNYSHVSMFEAMSEGKIEGLICFGQNPAVGGPNANMERQALAKLNWLVAIDLWETETAGFWTRNSEFGIRNSEFGRSSSDLGSVADIKTEVFLLPAAASFEKEGSIINSGRWAQWRYKAVEPPGEAKSDLWILNALYLKIKELYEKEGGAYPEPIINLNWNYGNDEPDVRQVAKEINGYDTKTGKQLPTFAELRDDGSTASGNWLYCGSYTEEGNMMMLRELDDPTGIGLYPRWAWCWPINRRILYNRASCDAQGKPNNPGKRVIWWTGTEWTGDVPDYGKTIPPEKNVGPFIMTPEGRARLFGKGLVDGPFPEHYEPLESPVKNLLSSIQNNPVIHPIKEGTTPIATAEDVEKYPIIATTYRLTEHWQAGQMTRNSPWLVELRPKMFVEISKSLAEKKGIKSGDEIRVISARGEITAYATVTDSLKPFNINGKMYETIGLPWHYGFIGLATGCSANCLTHDIGDANTMIPEYKAFLCDIQKI